MGQVYTIREGKPFFSGEIGGGTTDSNQVYALREETPFLLVNSSGGTFGGTNHTGLEK